MTADRSLGAGPVKLKVSLTQEPNNLGSVRFKITVTYIGQGRSSKQLIGVFSVTTLMQTICLYSQC